MLFQLDCVTLKSYDYYDIDTPHQNLNPKMMMIMVARSARRQEAKAQLINIQVQKQLVCLFTPRLHLRPLGLDHY